MPKSRRKSSYVMSILGVKHENKDTFISILQKYISKCCHRCCSCPHLPLAVDVIDDKRPEKARSRKGAAILSVFYIVSFVFAGAQNSLGGYIEYNTSKGSFKARCEEGREGGCLCVSEGACVCVCPCLFHFTHKRNMLD